MDVNLFPYIQSLSLAICSFMVPSTCRNPKRGDQGKSVMQPVAPESTLYATDRFLGPESSSTDDRNRGTAQPGSTAFAALAAQDVKAEDVFFHRCVLSSPHVVKIGLLVGETFIISTCM